MDISLITSCFVIVLASFIGFITGILGMFAYDIVCIRPSRRLIIADLNAKLATLKDNYNEIMLVEDDDSTDIQIH